MKIQDWKNEELGRLLREKWGLDEKRFANDPKLDKDGDGKPKWADSDDDDPEELEEIFSGAVPSEPAAKREDDDPEKETVDEGHGSEHSSPEMGAISPEEISTLQALLSKVADMLQNPEPAAEEFKAPMPDEFDLGVYEESEELEEGEAFAPNHYCVHHGGVQHEGKVKMAEAISHNYDEELGRVTRYDMRLEDGTVLENIAAEDIQITEASLADEHSGHRQDDDKKKKKKPIVMKQEQELRESIRTALLKLREQNKI